MNINIPFAPIYLFICEYLTNILSLGINFNLEFINTKADVGHAMTDLVGRYESSSSSSSSFSQPCAFLGAMSSVVSSSTSTLNNLNGYPQISGYSTSTVRTWYMAYNSFFSFSIFYRFQSRHSTLYVLFDFPFLMFLVLSLFYT